MQLNGKAVLVTGAASGLGQATAIAAARAGASLFLVDVDELGLEVTRTGIANEGQAAHVRAGDLASPDFCREAVEAAITAYGRLDALCNVAGIIRFHRFCDVTQAEWDRIIAVNLSAPFYLSQAALPELIRTKGSLLNVASSGGVIGTAYFIPYAATKAGLIHMTRSLAMEFSHEDIRINAIAPGPMHTNIANGLTMPEGIDMSLVARTSGLREPSDPYDIANLIVFVLSGATKSLHGAIIPVDNGTTAG